MELTKVIDLKNEALESCMQEFQNSLDMMITARARAVEQLVENDLLRKYIMSGKIISYKDFLEEAKKTYEIEMIERNGAFYYAGLSKVGEEKAQQAPEETKVEHVNEPIESEKLLSRKEVEEILGVAGSTLSNWTTKGSPRLPFYRIGHLVKYKQREVLEFIKNNKTVRGLQ